MYRKSPIMPPWGGWDDSAPALTLPNNSFQQTNGWMINKQRLRLFPRPKATFTLPAGLLWGARTFADLNNSLHTLLLTDTAAYFLNSGGTLNQLGSSWLSQPRPYALITYNGKVYFSNGGPNALQYVDGSTLYLTAGDAFGSCFYLGKLAARLLMINTVENGFNFPNQIRWSAINNGNEWDSTVDYTAGTIFLSDIEDALTGWATINNSGFAFRTSGITVLSPTGIGAAPWFVESFSIGPSGLGNAYPYSLAQYGQTCVFISTEDIYYFTGQAPSPIGGKSKKQIYNDLASSSSSPQGFMLGKLADSIDYLSYWLLIPQNNDTTTSLWIYHFDSQSWMNTQLPFVSRTLARLVLS